MPTGFLDISTRQKVAFARIISAALQRLYRMLGKGPEINVVRGGSRWQLDLREGIDLAIYLGVYETDLSRTLQAIVKPGSTVLDIGANIGAQALILAHSAGATGHLIAIEPTAYAYDKLVRNFGLNPVLAARSTLLQAMLIGGQRVLPDEIVSSWPLADGKDGIDALTMGRTKSTDGAERLSMDELVRNLNLPSLDLIKIDVDGNELEVLAGGRETLLRFKPIIAMEFAPHVHSHRPNGFADFLDFVLGLPYDLETLEGERVDLRAHDFRYGSSEDLILRPRI